MQPTESRTLSPALGGSTSIAVGGGRPASEAVAVARAQALVETTDSQIPTLQQLSLASIHRLSVLLGREPSALADELGTEGPIPSGDASLCCSFRWILSCSQGHCWLSLLPTVVVGRPVAAWSMRPASSSCSVLVAPATRLASGYRRGVPGEHAPSGSRGPNVGTDVTTSAMDVRPLP